MIQSMIPAFIISVPYALAWAKATEDKKAFEILEEILNSIVKGKVVKYDVLDNVTDRLYEHIQKFSKYKKSDDIPEDKGILNPKLRYEVEMVNMMAYLMNILKTMDIIKENKVRMDLDQNTMTIMYMRMGVHTIEYQTLLKNLDLQVFKIIED